MSGTLRRTVVRDGDEWPDHVLKFDQSWSNSDRLVVWYVDRQQATPFRTRHGKADVGT